MSAKLFAKKVVIITGAASGIGAKTAELFAKEGAHLVIADKDCTKLEDVKKKCSSKSACEPMGCMCDVTNDKDLKQLVECAVKIHNKLDIVVNSAGIITFDNIECTNLETFQRVFKTNIRSIVNMAVYAVPQLIKSKGNMVCVSSTCGIRGFPNLLSYCVSKAAIDQFVRCASLDLASKGVRVNGINPGVVDSSMYMKAGLTPPDIKEFYKRAAKTHPLGGPGKAEDAANLISFLASPKADWITGACFCVDGGWQLNCPI